MERESNSDYGPLASEFYQLTKPIERDYEDVFYYLLQLKKVKGQILEVGSGTGRLIVPLLKSGLGVEALEPSASMLRWLETNLKKYLKDKAKQVPIHRERAENFVAKERFEAIVISFGSFQLFAPRKLALQCLKNCFDNLKNGGRLFLDVDIIRPETHKAGLKSYGTRIKSMEGAGLLLEGARHWDFVEQSEHVHLRYEKWKSTQLLQSETQDFSLRWYGRWEMESLLKEMAFKKVEVFFDYQTDNKVENPFEPLDENIQTLNFVAYK